MKITYLKLENFIGIKYGMDRYEVEIDFTKGRNIITLFAGANGGGKTTILSSLSPYSGTMDDRNAIILPDKDGYKEIHYKKDNDEYIIKHHYLNKRKSKQIKSYISKNGEELNENGTVKSFEEIVEKELDVTPSFFILSRIGSNVKNFIGLKPAERKNYMSKFLPDVSVYLEAYKKVNNTYLNTSKKIKSVTAEIDKLDNEESLLSQQDNLNKNLKKVKNVLQTLMADINKNKGILSTLDIDSIEDQYDTAEQKLNKIEKNFKATLAIFNNNLDYSDLDEETTIDQEGLDEELNKLLTKVSKDLASTEGKLTESSTLLTTTKKDIEEIKSEIQKLKSDLESYKLDKDLDEFIDMEEEYKNKLKFINKKMSNYDDKYKLDIEDEDVNVLSNFVKHLQTLTIFNNYHMNDMNIFIENYTKNKCANYNENVVTKLANNINKLEDNIKKINEEIIFLQSKLSLKEVLDTRPSNCKIDTCGFISEALKYSSAEEEIDKRIELLEKEQDKLDKENNKLNEVKIIIDINNNFKSAYNLLINFSEYDKLVKLFPNIFGNEEEFISFITMDKNFMIDEFQKAIDYSHLFMDKEQTNELLKEVKYNIEILKSKDKLIKKTQDDIKKKTDSYNSKKNSLQKLIDDVSKYTEKRDNLKEEQDIYSEMIKCIETYNKLKLLEEKFTTIKEKVSGDKQTIEKINKENETNLSNYHEQDELREDLQKQLDDVNYKLKRLQEFKNDLSKLNETYNNIDIIRKALSPTKGIPLLFVDVYLKKTKNIANRLLDIAYNGRFYIEDFELTDSDFFIKIVKDGNMRIQDVTLTSQGEMSLISLAFSFAMIEQSKKKYNVILLDEIDKELDSSNRRAFVDIIEKQLNDMGVEQCFIISHNQEFDTSNLDLLLFNDHEVDKDNDDYMNGKTIIFEA